MAKPLTNAPSYEEFQKWVQKKGIKTKDEFKKRKDELPKNYPQAPEGHYKRKGTWKGWPDLFGTESPFLTNPPSYEEFQKWVQKKGIKTKDEFFKRKDELPKNYPKDPGRHYKKERTWKGWPDLTGKESPFLTNPPSYEEFQKWVQKKGIKTKDEFKKRKDELPKNYPQAPEGHYKRKGTWKGWPDLFGTESPYLENPPSYEEFQKWVQKKGIKTKDEFFKRKDELPKNYPKNPADYYRNKGTWKGWPDLTGTESPFLTNAPSYEEFQKWVQKKGIKTQSEFKKRKDELPKNYPKGPDGHYRNKGTWKGWPDLTGTESHFLTNAPSYEEFQKWVQKKGIKTQSEFKKRKDELPKNYPQAPEGHYKRKGTWKGWPDLTGTESPFLTNAPSYEEFQKWVQKKGIKTQSDLKKRKDELPKNYPKAPDGHYKKEGTWKGWPDLFGTESPFLTNPPSYEEFQKWVQKKGIKTKDEFFKRKDELPKNYPKDPADYYRNKGTWKGWYDFLGKEDIRYTVENLSKFVKSLLDSGLLDGTKSAGFNYFLMMRNKNINLNSQNNRKIIRTLVEMSETPTGRKTLQEIAEGNFQKWIGKIEEELDNRTDDPENKENISKDKQSNPQNYLSDKKREENSSKIYDEMDVFETINVDEEAKDFIYRFFINRLWINCFEAKWPKELQKEIEISKKEINHKNEVKRTIAKAFLEEYEGATNLPIPPLKALDKKTGKPITPWLSQQLTAYKVTKEKHFANFSGTGAGKTLSAIIASKAINAKMTVIICPNALVQNGQWENEAESCFDGNHTITGYDAFLEKHDKTKSKFLIINWDKLNQKGKSEKLVKTLAKQKIDLIVIDEIHFAKNEKSIRFINLGSLITAARRKNPELKTLAMTATPVVNELIEGKNSATITHRKKIR